MNNNDLNNLYERLKSLLANIIADKSFIPQEFIPTAIMLSPNGESRICGFPLRVYDRKAAIETVRAMHRMFYKEAAQGRLVAYGFVILSVADTSGAPAAINGAVYFLEHECGDGCYIEQIITRDASGSIRLGEETQNALPEGQRLWSAN